MLAGGTTNANEIVDAARVIDGARLDASARSLLAVDVLQSALDGISAGTISEQPSAQVFGRPLTENGLRRGLEGAYRDLARVTSEPAERIRLVDAANALRVRSLV